MIEEVMKMIINITPPKSVSFLGILVRTKKYYKLKKFTYVVEGKEKEYYIFLRKKSIQIKIVNPESKIIIEEIQKYLDYIFKDNYIGIQEKYRNIFELKRARLISLS